jgi:inorganic triphosphatase YgiF
MRVRNGSITVAAREPGHEAKEIELKLAFDPADAALILAHPILEAGDPAPKMREPISIYYDTGDDVLRKAGVFLRVRATSEGYVQTIKTAGVAAEFLERHEWEQALSSHEPDLALAEGTALAPLLTPAVRAALGPRFHTRFRRKTYHIKRDATEIEVAIDQGEITAGVDATPISELELELKTGHTRELFQLARALAESAPLTLAVKTKAERAFELIDGGDHDVEKASNLEITPDMTAGHAFRTIARNCLRQIVVNTPAMRAGHPEALHQLRIGLRRLRAGLAVFAGIAADGAREHIMDELRWIARELGPARDLDVFEADVLAPLRAAHPDDPEVAAAQRDFAAKRAAAYARAAGAAGSSRFRIALIDLTAWIETGAWADDRTPDEALANVAKHAAAELSRLRRRVKKRGRNLRDLSVADRHRLRIRAKRLRYATEFFTATFQGKKCDKRRAKSLTALKDLQDALGTLNDLATRRILLAAEAPERQSHEPGESEPEERRLLKEAERAYARFAKVKSFWK